MATADGIQAYSCRRGFSIPAHAGLLGLMAGFMILACSCTPQGIPAGLSKPTSTLPASATGTTLVPMPEIESGERWIEVELSVQTLRLREGDQITAEYSISSGLAESPETTTFPGVYEVQQKISGPIENVPGVFVSDILIYDINAGVGIHSMPMDKDGNFLDETLGKPATAGCVRVRESREVFDFARLGAKIWVH